MSIRMWCSILHGIVLKIDRAYAVINRAWENIANRWTKERKRSILQSRIESTQFVAAAIRAAKERPRLWVQALATGFYGQLPIGGDESSRRERIAFWRMFVKQWEQLARNLDLPGVRVVIIRTV